MKDRTKPPDDMSLSALACGCDPRENYKCKEHDNSKQCVMGHWIRRKDCPACQVLLKEKES